MLAADLSYQTLDSYMQLPAFIIVTVHSVHSNICTEIAKTAISRMSASGLSR